MENIQSLESEYVQKITTTTTTTTVENTIKITNVDTNLSTTDTNLSTIDTNLKPTYLYVLSDNVGYVGTYYSISDIEEITSSYYLVTFMIQCFKVSKDSELFDVWVVLYKDIDAVAYVSNNKEDAAKVHATLMQMGIAYVDSIDYWKQKVGLSPHAKQRLDLIHSIKDKKILDDSYNILIHKLNLSTENLPDGPIQNFINETQKITIMDCIVPSLIRGEGDSDGNDADGDDGNYDVDDGNDADDADGDDGNDDVDDGNSDGGKDLENKLTEHKTVPKVNKFKFCPKCQLLVDDLLKSLLGDINRGEELLMTFIAKHCYLCMSEIRNIWRASRQKKMEAIVNTPIESPYISTSVNNNKKDEDKLNVDKLNEVISNLTSLIKQPGEEDLKDLNIEEKLNVDQGEGGKGIINESGEDNESIEDVEI